MEHRDYDYEIVEENGDVPWLVILRGDGRGRRRRSEPSLSDVCVEEGELVYLLLGFSGE